MYVTGFQISLPYTCVDVDATSMPKTWVRKLDTGKPNSWPNMGSLGWVALRWKSAALEAKVEQPAAEVRIMRTIPHALVEPVRVEPCRTIEPVPPPAVMAQPSMPAVEAQKRTTLAQTRNRHLGMSSRSSRPVQSTNRKKQSISAEVRPELAPMWFGMAVLIEGKME